MITIIHAKDGACQVQVSGKDTCGPKPFYYVGGFNTPPNYPVPTLLGEVVYSQGDAVLPDLILITCPDERADPVFTWDEVNGIWDTCSPNHPYNWGRKSNNLPSDRTSAGGSMIKFLFILLVAAAVICFGVPGFSPY